MRNRTSTLLFALLLWLSAFGAPVSKQKAQKLVENFLKENLPSSYQPTRAGKNALKAVDATPYYYVFSIGSQKGFVIASADDRTEPIFGYTLNGKFDKANLPEGLCDLLSYYAKELQLLDQRGETVTHLATRAGNNRTPIEQLMETQWNQSAPYNNNCPMDGKERSVTGCVATAMAQIMFYHKWPQNMLAKPIAAYTTKTKQIQCEALESTSFEWEVMLHSYQGNPYKESEEAVAKLMRYVGQSLKMDYSAEASSTNSGNCVSALSNYFGYSKGMKLVQRSDYAYEEWNNLIYNELKNNRPVYYSASTQTRSGHAFVCDGYKEGDFFHINWGWGGMSDGYYRLSVLRPNQAGIGGNADAYALSQDAIIGIKPAIEAETTPIVLTVYQLELNPSNITRNNKTSDFNGMSLHVMFTNRCGTDFNGKIGVGLFKDNQLISVLRETNEQYVNDPNTVSGLTFYGISFGKGLDNGTYQLKAIYQVDGETEWKVSEDGDKKRIDITITDTQLKQTTADNRPRLEVKEVKMKGSKEIGVPLTITLTVENKGGDCNEEWNFNLDNKIVAIVGAYIAANATNSIEIKIKPQKEGTLSYYIQRPDGSKLYKGTIEVGHYANKELPKIEIKPNLGKDETIEAPTLTGTIVVTNDEAGTYANGIDLVLYIIKKGTNQGYPVETYQIDEEIAGNTTVTLPFTFNSIEDGANYFIIAMEYRNNTRTLVEQTYSYNAKFLPSGIDAIGKNAHQDHLPIYNLRGVKVGTGWKALQHLPKGIYIIGGKKVAR